MRRRHLLLVLALLLWVSSSQAQNNTDKANGKAEQATGTIGGTVLRKDTGEPIRFAHVSLSAQSEKQDDQEGAEEIEQKPATVTTDTAGRFAFNGLIGGKYQISVGKSGFVEEAYGARQPGEQGLPFKLDAGQHAEDLIFKLTPAGVISGHVRDENGEPVPTIPVSALQNHYQDGKRALLPMMVVTTNDLGEFRLFNLTPGKYFVSAAGSAQWGVGGATYGAPVSLVSVSTYLVTVYYPGTTDASQAVAIDVQAGAELHAVDLALQSSRTFHVRGQVAGMIPAAKGEIGVILRKAASMMPEKTAPVDKDGKFDFEGIAAGSYDLMSVQETEGKPIFAHRSVEVSGADVEGVALAFEAPTVVEGHLKWDDGAEPTKGQLQVNLQPVELNFAMQRPAEIRNDGGFEIKQVPPDVYTVDISGAAPDAYLKSARYGDGDAMGPFRVGGGSGNLELIVGAHGARVSGVVMNSDPVVMPGVWVALIPEESKQKQKRLYQAVKTDASGKYEFRGLAPGNYSLFSWDQVEEHEWEDPEFMKAFEGKGAAVTVDEKENKSVDLTLIENRNMQPKK